MYCRHCGSANDGSNRFCNGCGKPLTPNETNFTQAPPTVPTRQPVYPAQPPVQQPVYPPQSAAPVYPARSPEKKKRTGLIAVILVLLCLLIVAAVVIVYLLTEKPSDEPKTSESIEMTKEVTEPDTTPTYETDEATYDVPTETEPPQTEPPQTEPPQTEPPQTEPPQVSNKNMLDNFTAQDHRGINIFLSNFSEQHYDTYDASTSDYDLVNFAYLHLKINNYNAIGQEGANYYVTKENVDQTLYRFFGRTVPQATVSKSYGNYTRTFEYRNGAYYTPAADGEAYNCFTVATEMYNNGDGTYTVYFNVYELDIDTYFSEGMTNSLYEMSYVQVSARTDVSYRYSGSALIRDYDGGSFKNYQIITYNSNP